MTGAPTALELRSRRGRRRWSGSAPVNESASVAETEREESAATIESLPLLVKDLLQVFGDADRASSWVCWDRRGSLCHSPFERMSTTLSAEVLEELAVLEKRVRG